MVPLVKLVKDADKTQPGSAPKEGKSTTDKETGETKSKGSDQSRGQGDEGKSDKKEDETVNVDGEKVTLQEYLKKRNYKFLHHYAGKNDPLTTAVEQEAESRQMLVDITSCEKEAGVDLLLDKPYNQHCKLARTITGMDTILDFHVPPFHV